MTLKEVTYKTAADGKLVDRSVKNVALTDQEILLILNTFRRIPFDLEQELEHALNEHPDTIFEI
jgi:hypothetical protein|tara:strand:+ start:154 stop:345 length:192 start_codon:yes stop_codon:yes gene_type:complete